MNCSFRNRIGPIGSSRTENEYDFLATRYRVIYHDAIEEFLDAQEARAKFLEKECGSLYSDDLREFIKKEICKLLEINEPYARVLMDLGHRWYKDENLYALTEIAKRKNKKPSYVIRAWM